MSVCIWAPIQSGSCCFHVALGVGEIRGAEHADENLRLMDFARRRIDDPDPLARVVDERLFPGDMVLPQSPASVRIREAGRRTDYIRSPLGSSRAGCLPPEVNASLPHFGAQPHHILPDRKLFPRHESPSSLRPGGRDSEERHRINNASD
jgi:hypothetical protein